MKKPLLLGLDIGSTTAKAVLLAADGHELGTRVSPVGHDPRAVAARLRAELLRDGRRGARLLTVATGYGRAQVAGATRTVTEITCHARGVRHFHPQARTIVDIGGQDAKVIRLDASGQVQDFVMNDRCAAGTGAFLDMIAARFGWTLEELSGLYARKVRPLEVNSTCAVFAATEVVGLIARGRKLENVLAGVQRAVARQVVTAIKQLGPVEPLYFSGGVALNETVRREIKKLLGRPVRRCREPQLTAARGAALLAGELQKHGKARRGGR